MVSAFGSPHSIRGSPIAGKVQSLGRDIVCNDGKLAKKEVWFKPKQLRRLWTGLSGDELVKLSLRRKGVAS
jgi:hypothetical protein